MRHDFRETNLFKAKFKRRSPRFNRKPLSPELPCQPPTDLDSRREAGDKADAQQSDSTHEYAGCS